MITVQRDEFSPRLKISARHCKLRISEIPCNICSRMACAIVYIWTFKLTATDWVTTRTVTRIPPQSKLFSIASTNVMLKLSFIQHLYPPLPMTSPESTLRAHARFAIHDSMNDLLDLGETVPLLFMPTQRETYIHAKASAESLVISTNLSKGRMMTAAVHPSGPYGKLIPQRFGQWWRRLP